MSYITSKTLGFLTKHRTNNSRVRQTKQRILGRKQRISKTTLDIRYSQCEFKMLLSENLLDSKKLNRSSLKFPDMLQPVPTKSI